MNNLPVSPDLAAFIAFTTMPRFLVTIYMKNGKKYTGIREAADQYQLYQEYEAKIREWEEYPQFKGLTIVPAK